TMAAAAREVDGDDIADRFFVVASYLSTATVLYKRGGFSAEEVDKLRDHTRALSFDEIYSPGFEYDTSQTAKVLEDYRKQIFDPGSWTEPKRKEEAKDDAPDEAKRGQAEATPPTEPAGQPEQAGAAPPAEPPGQPDQAENQSGAVPATVMGQLAWHYLVHGG